MVVVACALLFSTYPVPGVFSKERHLAKLSLTREALLTRANFAEEQHAPSSKSSEKVKTLSTKQTGQKKSVVKLSRQTAKKLQVFLNRFSTFIPGSKVEFKIDEGPAPTGFIIIRYSITSSLTPALDRKGAILLSEDRLSVFTGHAMSLGDHPVDVNDVKAPENLSSYFSRKAGTSIKISWGKNRGPDGVYPAVIEVQSPFGNLKNPGAVTADGKWFLFGTFFPLDRDPRIERMKRLSLKGRVALGPPDAIVTLVALSDFQCPACADLHPKLRELVLKYAPDVRLVRVDLPQWRVHQWAVKAAEWSHCVQGFLPDAYWHFAEMIFLNQSNIDQKGFSNVINPVVSDLGLNTPAFQKCCRSSSTRKSILDDLRKAASAGISGSPTVLVNGVLLDMDIQNLVEPAVVKVRKDLLKDSQAKHRNNHEALLEKKE